jgi:hypothetical protein
LQVVVEGMQVRPVEDDSELAAENRS